MGSLENQWRTLESKRALSFPGMVQVNLTRLGHLKTSIQTFDLSNKSTQLSYDQIDNIKLNVTTFPNGNK